MTTPRCAPSAEELARANEELRRLVVVDPLTGLWNRQHADEELGRVCGFARRRREPVSVVLVELVDLDAVRSARGEAVADEVVRHAARALRETARREDVLARWDDDRFLLVLLATTEEGAERAARRITRLLGSRPFDTPDGPIELRVGIGTSTGNGADPDELLRCAGATLAADERLAGYPMRRSTPAQ